MTDRVQQIEERLASQLRRASAVLPIEYDHTTHADLRWLLDERKALMDALRTTMDALAVLRFPAPNAQAPGEPERIADSALTEGRAVLAASGKRPRYTMDYRVLPIPEEAG